jgi:hypothetical protein
LFLKMAKETEKDGRLPAGCRWDDLKALPPGGDQLDAYKAMLLNLGRAKDPLVKAIYTGAQTALREPRFVTQLVGAIDDLNWFSAKTDGLGDDVRGAPREERQRDQERRRPVLHAAPADRGDGRGDEAAGRRDRAGPGGRHGAAS